MSKGSIWFLFGLVTAIQIIGNIFYEFKDINPSGEGFIAWIELIRPLFEDWDILDHRRFLATIQGGTLPIMSLTALHFYIKFNDLIEDTNSGTTENNESPEIDPPVEEHEDIGDITDAEEIGRIKMTKPSDLLVKDSDRQVKDVRGDTPITLNKEIDPRTGKYKIM